MNTKLLRALAIQLQNAADNHGYTDAQEFGSDEKYEKAFSKSQSAFSELIERVCTKSHILTPLNGVDKATKDYLIMILEHSEISYEEKLDNE